MRETLRRRFTRLISLRDSRLCRFFRLGRGRRWCFRPLGRSRYRRFHPLGRSRYRRFHPLGCLWVCLRDSRRFTRLIPLRDSPLGRFSRLGRNCCRSFRRSGYRSRRRCFRPLGRSRY
ncbi:MAG: hypothetical protein RRY97_06840, partial [Oscillibacter sp.]